MILTCPQCGTRYQTDAALFTAEGRQVRCAKCGHSWHQPPEAPETETETASADTLTAAASDPVQSGVYAPMRATGFGTATPPPPPRRRAETWGVLAGWIAFLAILGIIGLTALRFRQEIATLWPQSASIFAAVGVEVSPRGIEFEHVSYNRLTEDGRPVLAVTGEIVNTSPRELSIPPILVTITDQNRQELYHWNYTPDAATLHPGQSITFLTRLPNPPDGTRHIEVRFAATGK
jgi:predicted Zn finger-like uncharacterized protein